MASQLEYVEILRALYHIDFIRRNFRNIQHQCTATIGPCPVCEIKDLFNALSVRMRNAAINPTELTSLISNTHLISRLQSGPGSIYSRLLSLLPRNLGLATSYSLTKVCLQCNTCAHNENVEKFSHKIEALPEKYPSFEFGLKASLDEHEFCEKPDCFGALRVFRVLKHTPSLLAFEFEKISTSGLPLYLKPCLIFECPSSTDLRLTCLTLTRPATLFYHSRLRIWILLDSTSITPIPTFEAVQALDLPIALAFYSRAEVEPEVKIPSPIITTAPAPIPTTTTMPIPKPPPPETRIYENWPLDSDSGQGSEVNSSLGETSSAGGGRWEEEMGKYATIKRRKSKASNTPLSVSVPDLRRLIDSKRVSFDCQVTLVEEDEYIPHPILQSILQQMRL